MLTTSRLIHSTGNELIRIRGRRGQAYIDGLSIFTEESFDWSASQCGIMLGVLGLSSPIVNQSVGRLSSRVSDRVITVCPPPLLRYMHL